MAGTPLADRPASPGAGHTNTPAHTPLESRSEDPNDERPLRLYSWTLVRALTVIRSDYGLAISVGPPTRNSSVKGQAEGCGDRAERWRIGFDSDLLDQAHSRSVKDRPALVRPESGSVSDAGI
jgi:hypothetical protein